MKRVLVVMLLLLVLGLNASGVLVVNSISQTLSAVYDIENGLVETNAATLGETANSAPNKVAIFGEYAYVVITYENAIQKIHLFSSAQRSMIYLETGALPNDIIIDEENHFAYVSGNGTNKVYKINLDNDEVVGSVNVGQAPQGMEIANGKLYVANTGFNMSDFTYLDGSVSIINLSDFTGAGEFSTDLNPTGLKKIGDKLAVVCTGNYTDILGHLDIVNISDNTNIATIEFDSAISGIAYYQVGNQVFVGTPLNSGVYVCSSTDYTILHNANEGIFAGGSSVCIAENYLAVADPGNWSENTHIRFYAPADFSLVSDVETGVGATDVKYYPGNLDTNNDVISQNNNFSMCYPNPFYSLNKEGCIKIKYLATSYNPINYAVFNIKGEKIYQSSIKSGENLIAWNGKDKTGQNVASGLYYFKIKAKKGTVVRKVTIVK